MRRRTFVRGLGALLLAPAPVAAADAPPSASLLAKPLDPVRSIAGLTIKGEDGVAIPPGTLSGRLTVINFWGPWCVPCRREMPSLSRLKHKLAGSTIEILPLAFDWRGAPKVRSFFADAGIDNFPVLLGNGENLDSVLGLSRLPTTAIVSAAGNCFATIAGEATWDDDATVSWLARIAAA